MEVFIRHLEPQASRDTVETWLAPILEKHGIRIFDLRKKKGKSFANLTVTDVAKAKKLIETSQSSLRLTHDPRSGRSASFAVSKNTPDPLLLKALRKTEKDWAARKITPNIGNKIASQGSSTDNLPKELRTEAMKCGRWESQNAKIVFVPFLRIPIPGILFRRNRALVLRINHASVPSPLEIVFDYASISSINMRPSRTQTALVLTTTLAPRVYAPKNAPPVSAAASGAASMLRQLFGDLNMTETKTMRKSSIPTSDLYVTGTCLVYHFSLEYALDVQRLQKRIERLVGNQVSVWISQPYDEQAKVESLQEQIVRLEDLVKEQGFSFSTCFQIHALWTNTLLSPHEVQRLVPVIASLRHKHNCDRDLSAIVRSVQSQVAIAEPGNDPISAGVSGAADILRHANSLVQSENTLIGDDEIAVHRVMITPTGTYLYGPDKEATNRVLRQYKGHEDCFLRVAFGDESGDKIQFDSETSNEETFRVRFMSVLQNGLDIAGQHFDFLGFSHSSLRSQTCWFMRSFAHRGSNITANFVIASLGDFSGIRSPAKCAARIGQAFTDTPKTISINPNHVSTLPDIKRNGFTFTDGCGTISPLQWSKLKKASSNYQPTLFQIRYKGAKGMLSLDSSLSGYQMRLRGSMIKFTGSPSDDIEICGMNSRPLPFKLNRPIIKILEDLGVKDEAFETIQEHAVERLRRSASTASSAAEFIHHNLAENHSGMDELILCLAKLKINVMEDELMRAITRALIEIQLRDLKFRTRIPVAQAVTLYGICDETNFLNQGEVYVTFATDTGACACLQGRVAVTRSPALHPGDIQIATAVAAPKGSALRDLTNCVVFSQRGARDMPSKLGGGDLDGDMFNIIYDDDLIPERCSQPAAYPRIEAKEIQRRVTASDMATFFIDFMESDQLGRIATLHQVLADRATEGTRSPECLKLAELHSAAVDFSKSGVPVNVKEIPPSPRCRPDFMAPSLSTKIHRGIKKAEEAVSTTSDDSQRYHYYESEKILGKLFRSINEDDFFGQLEDDGTSIFGSEADNDVLAQIWHWVLEEASDLRWQTHTATAQQVKTHYTTVMMDIMYQYAVGNSERLTEQEVLVGTIIGKSGALNKRQREQSELMKARYKRELQDIRQWMKDQAEDDPKDYLSLSIACLSLCTGVQEGSSTQVGDNLRSFPWFAAAICVPRLYNATKRLAS